MKDDEMKNGRNEKWARDGYLSFQNNDERRRWIPFISERRCEVTMCEARDSATWYNSAMAARFCGET